MGKFSNLKIIVISTVLTLFVSTVFSAVSTPRPAGTSRYQTKEEKLQQLQQEASAAAPAMDANYTKMIQYINDGNIPGKDELSGFQKSSMKTRKYLTVFDDSQKGAYHIFSAWLNYFDAKNDKALKSAETAFKTFPQNQNAVKSCVALSLVCRDYQAMMTSLTTQPQKPTRRVPPGATAEAPVITPVASTATGDLMLDVNAVRIDLVNKPFDSNLMPMDSSLPTWSSSGKVLCAMLWKIDSDELESLAPVAPKIETSEPNTQVAAPAAQEPNTTTPQPTTQPAQTSNNSGVVMAPGAGGVSPVNPNFMDDMAHPDSAPSAPAPQPVEQTQQPIQEQQPPPPPAQMYEPKPEELLSSSAPSISTDMSGMPQTEQFSGLSAKLEAFTKFQAATAKDKRIAFAIVNLNDKDKKANILNWLKKNPQRCQTVFLANENSDLMKAVEMANKPVMVIVGPDLVIRYAGEPNGFLPGMILNSIKNSPADANYFNASQTAGYKQPEPNIPAVPQEPANAPAEQPQIQPVATQDTNSVSTPNVPAATTKQDTGDFTAEDYQAQKLLENAKMYLKMGNRLQFHTYAKPVEMCRTVIRSYPNTKYATEAQMLLRQVPERFREHYKLTDQELGL